MPQAKQLLLVICKTSGSQVDVLPGLKVVLDKSSVTYDVEKVKTPPDLAKLLTKIACNYKAVAVYGGDGSIIAAIKALARIPVRLIILPGGTANLIAKDLQIPGDVNEALSLFTEGKYGLRHYDLASVNGQLFVLDMHTGWWAEAIADTPRPLKRHFGQLAYGWSALKKMPQHEKSTYELQFNGRTRRFKAHTIMIANQGFQNLLNVPLYPRKHRYGSVQLAVIKTLKPWPLMLWWLGKTIFKRNIGSAIRTYAASEITITKSPKDHLFDDEQLKLELPIRVVAGQEELRIVIPPREQKVSLLEKITVKSRLVLLRFIERLRNVRSGNPKYEYSRIAPHVYLGGAYRPSAYRQFKEWNVTGIVNMRKRAALPAPEGFMVLQLKTQDWHAPPLEVLKEGVEFIDAQIEKGGGAYVHCRQGEGRGPTMAAAYLINKGLTVDEALTHIQLCRPMSHPNRSQVKRLTEWQEYLAKNS
jgi:diacylglycerol kinase family enzyme